LEPRFREPFLCSGKNGYYWKHGKWGCQASEEGVRRRSVAFIPVGGSYAPRKNLLSGDTGEDGEASADFYSSIFGWKIRDAEMVSWPSMTPVA
jgi:hypothetical protein